MTMTPPVVNPVTLDPSVVTFRAPSDIQPFSYKDGDTYLTVLYNIRRWLYNSLVPYLNTNFGDLQGGWEENVAAIDDSINAALAQQATNINNALTAQQQQVADSLQTTLNEITSGENAALNDSAIYNALQVANSQTLAFLDTRYDGKYAPKATAFGFYLLTGSGIDLTGATDSTTAVKALVAGLPDNSSVVVPSGATITLSDTIEVGKQMHFSGDGELRWTSGIDSKPMIHVTADGFRADGLYLTNPNHLAAQTGGKTYGIFIEASHARIVSNRIVGQQQAVAVGAAGEFHDFTIIGNLIEDVPGSGDGASSNSTTGEDRGDGIVVWGATATIVGNRVYALANTDARIGIHTEALSTSENIPYVHGDSHTVIGNNIVTGKFRRSITSEGVSFCTITGNTIADPTWWGINLSNTAHNCIVADNTIEWTRISTDNQGSAWSPLRSGIMVYDQVQNAKIRGNTIVVVSGALMPHGITVQASANDSAHKSQNVSIEGNRITDPAYGITNGVHIPNGATAARIVNNDIDGFTANGINCQFVDAVSIHGNRLIGNSASVTAKGVLLQASSAARSTWAKVHDNIISFVVTALALYNRTVFVTAIGNIVQQSTNGIDFYDSATAVATINSNTFIGVTTKLANIPTQNVQIGNN